MSKDHAAEGSSSRGGELERPQTVEEWIEAMYQRMQEPGFVEAMLQAFKSKPRVRIELGPTNQP
jgi:hypothetical protein